MKFAAVFDFEFKNYVKNKTYIVTTFVLGLLIAALLFLPRVIDMSGILGTSEPQAAEEQGGSSEEKDNDAAEPAKKGVLALYDKAGIFTGSSVLTEAFPDMDWLACASEDEVKKAVEEKEAEAGFVMNDALNFDYYVFNKGMGDSESSRFSAAATELYRQHGFEAAGIDYGQVQEIYGNQAVKAEEYVLGKDTMSNYWYCYMLVIVIFMMIIFYGIMIATSVTTEKSNRSIEVLVTSVDSNILLFGKVIAGAVAGALQMAVVLGLALLSYQINREAWGGMLDMLLNIPGDVLLTFAFFGIGGYLFYAFLYGAMGALVSKTEDINKSAGGVQMVIMLVYFAVLIQLSNPDGMIMKVASFLPFSSYSAMFARMAMGTVAIWEVIVSGLILIISIIGVGLLAAKIYRMGTLRYGNPIKLSNALKGLKEK